ncbi:MAG: hypothetical protein WEA10_08540 [Actinomycetota bacterium]
MNHDPGTFAECEECQDVAYEPGWYSLLKRLSDPKESRDLWIATGGAKDDDYSDTF